MPASGRERRAAARYPVRLGLNYRLIQRNLVVDEGPARTENMSSIGIYMTADRTFPIGSLLEVFIEWPFLRDGIQPIELRLTGRVVRSGAEGTAIRALSHDSYAFGLRQIKRQSESGGEP